MADKIKVEGLDDPTYSLKLENDEMESAELEPGEEYQFATDSELPIEQYQDDSEQSAKTADMIDKYVIDNGSQVFDSVDTNTYVTTAIDDISHGEQFLTMPRGRTQITVCDNGNIVYTDDSALENTTEVTKEKRDDDGETMYYQMEDNDGSQEDSMEVENIEDTTEYIQQVVDSNQLQSGTFITEEESEEYTTENSAGAIDNFQAQAAAETVLNRTDVKKFITLQQDSSRGIKRPIPSSPNKNVVTKVFIQGSPSTSQGQPITIIGSLPGSVVGSRTLSIAQAQRLGLFSSNTKIQQGGSAPSPGRMLVKKITPASGSSVLAIKSPTKILPAPSPNKARIPALGVRSTLTPGNLMPVRTNIPVSQLKMLTAISSSTTQVRPLTITKNITTVGDAKKVYVRPATTVLSPITGQLTRIGQNATFQQIQIKGKQSVQYVKLIGPGGGSGVFSGTMPKLVKTVSSRSVPIAPSPVTPKSVGTASVVGNKIILPVSSEGENLIQLKSTSNIVPINVKGKAFTTVRSGAPFTEDNQIVLVPEDDKSESTQDDIEELCDKENLEGGHSESVLEANGIRPRKPCNCTKSQCLKLYCECFANGEFCFQCNCNNCFNNIEHEDERQLSIQSCLERNPLAFRPKFQIREREEEDRREKGCNCRRSACFKNYCECFEAKLPCSKVCKCQGCKNTEEEMEASRRRESGDELDEDENGVKTPKFMSPSLAEALCQCMLAQAEKAESNGDDVETTERRIVEEFGQCIVQIIGNRNKRDTR